MGKKPAQRKQDQKQTDQLKLVLCIVAGLILFFGIAYTNFGRPQQEVPVSISAPPTVKPISPVERVAWQTYSDSVFTIKYPSGWKVLPKEVQSTGTLITLTDLQTQIVNGQEQIKTQAGGGLMTIRVGFYYSQSLGRNLTLLEWLGKKQTEEISLAGQSARRQAVSETADEVEQNIYVEKEGKIYEINLRADRSLRKKYREIFNQMLATFQFAD